MSTLPATPRTVLAAIDFSDASDIVVEHALAMARQANAHEMHFLHVRPPASDAAEEEGRQTEFEEWLDARVRNSGSLPYTVKVVAHEASGNPADVIVEMAGDLLASAVIVGTHGRKGFQRMVMGSVAESVVRHAGCPVLVVRPQMHDQPAPRIEPPCPRCVERRAETGGEQMWCEQHSEKHGRRHTYYNTRLDTWVSHRLTL
ncbi:MAG TPA: universal stress protein [Polyangiaceae bacterium]|nr:universal stress protein [Polyangiaceae bacterium]